jgi:hypothetical protein
MRLPLTERFVCRAAVFVCVWAVVSSACALAQHHTADEYQVKAGFLFNFARFVDWPEADALLPIHVCVADDDSIARQFQPILKGKTAERRSVQVLRARQAADTRDCEIVFFPESSMARARSVLDGGVAPGVLTVGESAPFLEMGGMINLVVEDDRIRFEVNLAAAEKGNVKLSSKLLGLARIVNSGRVAGGR